MPALVCGWRGRSFFWCTWGCFRASRWRRRRRGRAGFVAGGGGGDCIYFVVQYATVMVAVGMGGRAQGDVNAGGGGDAGEHGAGIFRGGEDCGFQCAGDTHHAGYGAAGGGVFIAVVQRSA